MLRNLYTFSLSKSQFLVIQVHSYYCLCILSQKHEFSVFLVKIPIFHVTFLKEFALLFWLLLNLSFRYFLIHMHTFWKLHILGQKAVFL